MPTCKYCQKHVGFWEGGTFARLHPACSVELGRLGKGGRQAFDALTVSEREQYGDLDAAARLAFLEPKRLELEAQWTEEEAQRNARGAASDELAALAADAAATGRYDATAMRLRIMSIVQTTGMTVVDIDMTLGSGWMRGLDEARKRGVLSKSEAAALEVSGALGSFLEDVWLSPEDLADEATIERLTARQAVEQDAARAVTSEDESALMRLDALFEEHGIEVVDRRKIAINAWTSVAAELVEEGALTGEIEEALFDFLSHFAIVDDLSDDQIYVQRAIRQFLHAMILRRATESDWDDFDLPQAAVEEGHQIPFNLLKSETLVWITPSAHYSTLETQREFRGSSHGLSIRIAKGLYYRPSSFSGRSVASEKVTHADTGVLGVTTKHLYFHGPVKRFRVRYDKIVSFEPYSDGIGFMRDNLRAKPETFTVAEDDGWFLYNLVTNLAQQ